MKHELHTQFSFARMPRTLNPVSYCRHCKKAAVSTRNYPDETTCVEVLKQRYAHDFCAARKAAAAAAALGFRSVSSMVAFFL